MRGLLKRIGDGPVLVAWTEMAGASETGLVGHRRECQARVDKAERTYLGMMAALLDVKQTPAYLQIRVVFAGSLSMSRKMAHVGW